MKFDERQNPTTEASLPYQPVSQGQALDEMASLNVQLERARALEAEFRAFADCARDYAFITLGLDSTVLGWSTGAELLFGYSRDEILGMPAAMFFTPEDVARGEPESEARIAMSDGRAEDERWHMRKDGTRFWGSGVLTPVRDGAGNIMGFAKVMRDRTRERQFQEALRVEEERLRLVIENLRDCALFDLDRNGQIGVWSSGAERIFGYTAEEVLGVDAGEFFANAGYSAEAYRNELEVALASGRSEGESWLIRKNEARFFARWIINTAHGEAGQARGFVTVLRDETQRQQAQQDEEGRRRQFAWELMEQQARVTSSALGQTQTELTGIGRRLLNVQEEERRRIARDLHDHLAQRLALLESGLDRLRRGLPENLDQLRTEVAGLQEQTAALCQDVREISHRLHPSIIEHLGLIAALRSLCAEYQRGRPAPVAFEAVHNGCELSLEVATAFYRICEEALRNIQKHAGNVPVSVQIQADSCELLLRIKDTGPGFDPDSVKAAEHLGLISMRERASLVGAICKCKSEPGGGTTIEVRLVT